MSLTSDADLAACAREPIHSPGAIQPHGSLLVLDPDDLTILHMSLNAPTELGVQAKPGLPLSQILPAVAAELKAWPESERSYENTTRIHEAPHHVVAHRTDGGLLLEFERLSDAEEHTMDRVFPRLRQFTENFPGARDVRVLAARLARSIRELTDFDRVLVYQFDRNWNGHVIGEVGNGVLPSYLDLRFPADDIPAQARQLYQQNRVRIIPDVGYTPVPIVAAEGAGAAASVDLSLAGLRSVSPLHLEYMRNMGTAASMSVSILVDNRLWGLVACHCRDPHAVSLNIRNACDFVVQSAAGWIEARERSAEAATRVRLGEVLNRLLAQVAAASDWRQGLLRAETDLLAQVNASGAAILFANEHRSVGRCPSEGDTRRLVNWLERRGETELFHSDSLAASWSEAEAFADVGSGVLAIRISELHPSWLLWFRPEVVETVTWGGDPHKVVKEQGRIHPRRSFEAWKDEVRLAAAPWRSAEIVAARDLRTAIIGIVLRKAEELAQLTQELQRSNKELEAFSYSISHDLRAPFRHIVGFSQLLREREKDLDPKSRHYLDSISESALTAGKLVDDLLNLAHLGRMQLAVKTVDMNKLVQEVRRSLELTVAGRDISWRVGDLPPARGDPQLMRQVWTNLIDNAVKYTRPKTPAIIEIRGSVEETGGALYMVRDNGVGFDMAYVEKLFGVFQRLQRVEDFEGTGIGLALARRAVERHGGRIWAEGAVDKGATFMFALPKQKETTERA